LEEAFCGHASSSGVISGVHEACVGRGGGEAIIQGEIGWVREESCNHQQEACGQPRCCRFTGMIYLFRCQEGTGEVNTKFPAEGGCNSVCVVEGENLSKCICHDLRA
jgi:hypothetical protein